MNKEILEMYDKVQREHKKAFTKALANRLGKSHSTVKDYFSKEILPKKHIEEIKLALNIQLDFESKAREKNVEHYEILSNGWLKNKSV